VQRERGEQAGGRETAASHRQKTAAGAHATPDVGHSAASTPTSNRYPDRLMRGGRVQGVVRRRRPHRRTRTPGSHTPSHSGAACRHRWRWPPSAAAPPALGAIATDTRTTCCIHDTTAHGRARGHPHSKPDSAGQAMCILAQTPASRRSTKRTLARRSALTTAARATLPRGSGLLKARLGKTSWTCKQSTLFSRHKRGSSAQ